MANLTFISDCGDSTGDLSEFNGPAGNNGASIQTGTVFTGSRALQLTYPNSSTIIFVQVANVLADAGRRISFYFRFSANPAASTTILIGQAWGLRLTTAGNLQIFTGATSQTGSATLSPNTWYRLTLAYKITNSTTNSFKVFINDSASADATITNATVSVGQVDFNLGDPNTPVTANTNFFFDNIYIDDGTGVDNPSTNGLLVTRKAPNATGTNNAFDTAIGSATNRWDYVSELPISTAKGWEQAGSSQVIEAYGIESASQGAIDITGATILGYKAWIYAKGQDVTTGAPKTTATNNAKATGTTLALGPVTVAAGDVIVVLFGDQVAGTAPTIGDNIGGNTWTALSGPTTNTARLSKWYCVVANGGSMTVTVTFQSSAGARAGALGVWDATIFGASPLDANVTNANDSTSPYDCPLSGTLAQTDEIVLGFCSRASNAALAAGASETGIIEAHSSGSGGAGANVSVGLTYRKVSATTSIQPQMTGTSVAGVVGTASFKTTSIVAGTPKLVDNGSDIAIVLTNTATLYSNHTTTATYPSNGNTVGMKSSGSAMDSFLYECGIQIAYIPGAGSGLTQSPADDVNLLADARALGYGNLHADSVANLADTATVVLGQVVAFSDSVNNLADSQSQQLGVVEALADTLATLADTYAQLLVYLLQLTDSTAANWADAHQLLLAQFLALADSYTLADTAALRLEHREELADSNTLSDAAVVVGGGLVPLADTFTPPTDAYLQQLGLLSTFSDSFTLTDSSALGYGLLVADDANTLADVYAQQLHVVTNAVELDLSDDLALDDSAVLGIGLLTSDTLTFTDSHVEAVGETVEFSDALSTSDDSIALQAGELLELADAVVLTDSITIVLGYEEPLADGLLLADSTAQQLDHLLVVADGVTVLTDATALGFGLLITDATAALTDAIVLQQQQALDFSDVLVLSDSVVATLDHRKQVEDSVDNLADSAVVQLAQLLTFSDDADNLTDSAAQTIGELLAFTDSLTITDSRTLGYGLVFSDDTNLLLDDILTSAPQGPLRQVGETDALAALTDNLTLRLDYLLAVVDDAATLDDSIALLLGLRASFSDSFALTDSLAVVLGYYKPLADSFTLTDSVRLTIGYQVALADTLTLTDSIALRLGHALAVSDTVVLADSITLIEGQLLTTSDSFTLSDSEAAQLGQLVRLTDTLTITDSIQLRVGYELAVTDVVTLTDSSTQSLGYYLSLTDNAALLADSTTISLGLTVIISDNGPVLTESIDFFSTWLVQLADALVLSDFLTRSSITFLPLDDTLTITDAIAIDLRGPDLDASVADSLLLVDSITIVLGNELRYQLVISDTFTLTDHYFDLRYPYPSSARRHIVVPSRARETVVPVGGRRTAVPVSQRTTTPPRRSGIVVPLNERTTKVE